MCHHFVEKEKEKFNDHLFTHMCCSEEEVGKNQHRLSVSFSENRNDFIVKEDCT